MLRLVHPAPEGQGTVSPTRRKRVNAPALSLTAEETRHLRAALRNAVRAFGGFPALAQALSLPVTSLYRFTSPKRTLPGTFAVRLAKVLGISVESILTAAEGDALLLPGGAAAPHRGAGTGTRRFAGRGLGDAAAAGVGAAYGDAGARYGRRRGAAEHRAAKLAPASPLA